MVLPLPVIVSFLAASLPYFLAQSLFHSTEEGTTLPIVLSFGFSASPYTASRVVLDSGVSAKEEEEMRAKAAISAEAKGLRSNVVDITRIKVREVR